MYAHLSLKNKVMNMNSFKKLHILYSLVLFNLILMNTCMAQNNANNSTSYYCDDDDDIRTDHQASSFLNSSSLLSRITLCRSQNLYLRTSLGLFQVSSVDYDAKLLTISHSCSPSLHYVSPLTITNGFPSPPPSEQNSLLLINCSIRRTDSTIISPLMHSCIGLSKCEDQDHHNVKMPYPCLIIEDLHKVEKGFHPEDLNCSHYSWIHKTTSSSGYDYKLGTRMSFDIIRGHIWNPCRKCEKPDGNCGRSLKCFCHPKECKDKVIPKSKKSGSTKSIGNNILLSFLSLIIILVQ